MDSITQAALGAAVGGISVGRRTSKKVLLWGALAGTLPDLDILYSFFADDVNRLVSHRSVTHSFIIAPGAAYLCSRLWGHIAPRTALSPNQWFSLFFWCFITHITVDWLTVYGTQIFYPLSSYPYALSSLFIIDPFYTIPLLGGLAYFALSKTPTAHRRGVLIVMTTISTCYIVAALGCRAYAEHRFIAALNEQRIDYHQIETLNSPFNILIWRTVVITQNNNLAAWYSLLSPERPIVFRHKTAHPARHNLDALATQDSDLAKLIRFSKGFYRYEENDQGVQWVDLRFIAGDVYPFRYWVAVRDAQGKLGALETARRIRIKRRPSLKIIFKELYEHL